MTEALRKGIMNYDKIQTKKCLFEKSKYNWGNFNYQGNFSANLQRKTKLDQ